MDRVERFRKRSNTISAFTADTLSNVPAFNIGEDNGTSQQRMDAKPQFTRSYTTRRTSYFDPRSVNFHNESGLCSIWEREETVSPGTRTGYVNDHALQPIDQNRVLPQVGDFSVNLCNQNNSRHASTLPSFSQTGSHEEQSRKISEFAFSDHDEECSNGTLYGSTASTMSREQEWLIHNSQGDHFGNNCSQNDFNFSGSSRGLPQLYSSSSMLGVSEDDSDFDREMDPEPVPFIQRTSSAGPINLVSGMSSAFSSNGRTDSTDAAMDAFSPSVPRFSRSYSVVDPDQAVLLDKTSIAGPNYITADTLADLMRGNFNDKIANVYLIDCRFPFEYEGGHISGAISRYDPAHIESEFFKNIENLHQLTADKSVVIFYCEFSQKRGPAMYQTFREIDRRNNQERYPHVDYREMYILEGGYKKFFQKYSEICDPCGYAPMHDPQYSDQVKKYMGLVRRKKNGIQA